MDMFVAPGSISFEVRKDSHSGLYIPFPKITMRARVMSDGGFALEYVVWEGEERQVSTTVIPYEKRGENWVAINRIQDFFPEICRPGSLEHELFTLLEKKVLEMKDKQ